MPRRSKILTLDDLYTFFATQDTAVFDAKTDVSTFSAKKAGGSIRCEFDSTAHFDAVTDEEIDAHNGLFYADVKVAHTLLDYNRFYIEDDDMARCMPSLKDRPLLAHIYQLNDGTYDFGSHDKQVITDDDGNQYIKYLERQVGSFTSDEPRLEYNEDEKKNWVIARVAIPYDYSLAYDIIKAKGGDCKVSCELEIATAEFHKKEGYLKLIDFYFNGVTLLGSRPDGTPIGEGMIGAKATLINDDVDTDDDEPDDTSNFSQGGKNQVKFDELLKKYGKKAEDITFDYKDLSDEELEKKFAEEFEAKPEPEGEVTPDHVEAAASTPANAEFSVSINFELSQEDVRRQIYQMLENQDRLNHWNTNTTIIATFDDRFIYTDLEAAERHLYAQNYTKTDTGIVLDGEPYEVFAEYLTADEKTNLETMRANYPSLAEFKANADAKAENDAKEAVFAEDNYAFIKDTDAYKDLHDHMADFSVDQIREKLQLQFASAVQAAGQFSAKKDDEPAKKANVKHFNFSDDSSVEKDNPYPGMFEK